MDDAEALVNAAVDVIEARLKEDERKLGFTEIPRSCRDCVEAYFSNDSAIASETWNAIWNDGTLSWGFSADWDLVPDLHQLVLATEASFEELHRAATGG